ncbi:MAG: carboxymuconolactone decarboxylase family protein [Planctomycetaceae bacterium]
MTTVLPAFDALRETLPDDLKDLRLNAATVLAGETLEPAEALGTALAAALFVRSAPLVAALRADIATALGAAAAGVVADATAAAGLMAMNTVYFRFRHMVAHGREGKESYASRPARLRMGRIAQPATSKATFEMMSLACAALAGCEACIQSHEASLVQLGRSEEACHDAVRIAAVMSGVACGLDAVRTP